MPSSFLLVSWISLAWLSYLCDGNTVLIYGKSTDASFVAPSFRIGPARLARRHIRFSVTHAVNLEYSDIDSRLKIVLPVINNVFPKYGSSDNHGPGDGPLLLAKLPSSDERFEIGRNAQGLFTDPNNPFGKFDTFGLDSELTYGEFDVAFFVNLVNKALLYSKFQGPRCFLDVGSGCGRLVLAAQLCFGHVSNQNSLKAGLLNEFVGIEVVPGLHHVGLKCMQYYQHMHEQKNNCEKANTHLKNNNITLICGDIYESPDTVITSENHASFEFQKRQLDEPRAEVTMGSVLSRAGVIFCYSSALASFGDELGQLSFALGTTAQVGTLIITTDKKLVSDGPWKFQLLETVEGPNEETGGMSTGYIWKVLQSGVGMKL